MNKTAKKAPAYLKNAVVYQLFLRPFTTEGTFAAAQRMLPHLKETGINVIMLCPVNEADSDMNTQFWSPRQNKSGFQNPKNPYRISDYYKIDDEYGGEEQFREFVRAAHKLGIKVLMDLVFFHCGPTSNLLKDHPDFILTGPNGEVINGEWCFPQLNLENPKLRKYLIENMIYFVDKFEVDGYRMDVATPKIPLDFFVEARRALDAFKPDIIQIAEANNPTDQLEAFDAGYSCYGYILTRIFKGEKPIELRKAQKWMEEGHPKNNRQLVFIDNHDLASDAYDSRFETMYGADAKEALLVGLFAVPGIPMLYNGEEIADTNRHSIFCNRFHPGNLTIDWQNALTKTGSKRLRLIKKLTKLHHTESDFGCCAPAEFIDHESLILIRRGKFLIVINPTNTPATFSAMHSVETLVLKQGVQIKSKQYTFKAYSFLIVKTTGVKK